MKQLSRLVLALVIIVPLAACAVGYRHSRYGDQVVVAPDYWGTVTYYDPVSHRIDLDYVDGGVHATRSFYYSGARWEGIRENEIRTGATIHVRGRQHGDRWNAEYIGRGR